MNTKKRRYSSGQALPFMLVMMVVLIISWAMMVNIAQLLHDRIMMQNAADNAALSVAVYKARTLNYLGAMNYRVAALLLDGELGEILATLNIPYSHRLPDSRWLPLWGLTNYSNVGGIEKVGCVGTSLRPPIPPIIKGVLADYNVIYSMFTRYVSQDNVASAYDMAPHGLCFGLGNGIFTGTKYIERIKKHVDYYVKSTGINKGIQYRIRQFFPLAAINIAQNIGRRQRINSRGEPCGADLVTIDPTGLSLGLDYNQDGVDYYATRSFMFSLVPPLPPVHIHLFWRGGRAFVSKSWLYANRDNFAQRQKITVRAVKYGNNSSNGLFPLLGRWIGIRWPTIITTASAAVYNKKGPMFPVEQENRSSDNIIPVLEAYSKDREGGWYAHLIPQGGLIFH